MILDIFESYVYCFILLLIKLSLIVPNSHHISDRKIIDQNSFPIRIFKEFLLQFLSTPLSQFCFFLCLCLQVVEILLSHSLIDCSHIIEYPLSLYSTLDPTFLDKSLMILKLSNFLISAFLSLYQLPCFKSMHSSLELTIFFRFLLP